MKKAIAYIVLIIASFPAALSQGGKIRLPDLIDAALNNRGNIAAISADLEIASLRTSGLYSEYLPRISALYDLRYNMISPTQIIPVGQFNPIPTDEKRAIRFGTDWQQNAGLSLYQPLIDLSIRSRVAESRINEKLMNTDAEAAERDLISEVIRSFMLVRIREEQVGSAETDTLRTARTLELIIARAGEGKVLKTDINRAILNHNNALVSLQSSFSELVKEKLYLGFLTGYPLESLLNDEYDFSSSGSGLNFRSVINPVTDSIPEIEKLRLQAELIGRQQKTEISMKMPVLGIDGFLGASQYADTFDPFKDGTWYGSSYLGISLRLPIRDGDNTRNRLSQLRLEAEGIRARIADEKARIENKGLLLAEEIRQLEYQIEMSEQNASLLKENISLFQDRYSEGQLTAYDLLNQETDLLKEQSRLNEQRARLLDKEIEMIINSGYLGSYVEDLRAK